jgi:hypothetical protein
MSVNVTTIINDAEVRAKLLAAAPRILAQNRVLVQAMLEPVKAAVIGDTPTGPGHFGYHGRDTVKIDVTSTGIKTTGKLLAAVQLYWREYGTGIRFRGKSRSAAQQAIRIMTGASTGGEPALMVANKALNYTRRLISFYYNGMANWWRS